MELRTKTQRDEREGEMRGELVKCKILRRATSARARAWRLRRGAGGCGLWSRRDCGLGARAARRPPGTAPARHRAAFRLEAHDHRNKRMILWYMPTTTRRHYTPVPKYRGSPAQAPLTCHTLNTQHRLDRQHTVHARHPGRRCTSRCQCLPVHCLECRGPRTATGALGRGPGHNAHGTSPTRALWNSLSYHTRRLQLHAEARRRDTQHT